MKPNALAGTALAICTTACTSTTGGSMLRGVVEAEKPWRGQEQTFVSILSKKQDANVLRLAQQRASEKALEEKAAAERKKAASQRQRVPPSMFRTTEPPLPEPDFSLPITEIPRSAASPGAASTPQPTVTPQPSPSAPPSRRQ
jgi:hypothetical protein